MQEQVKERTTQDYIDLLFGKGHQGWREDEHNPNHYARQVGLLLGQDSLMRTDIENMCGMLTALGVRPAHKVEYERMLISVSAEDMAHLKGLGLGRQNAGWIGQHISDLTTPQNSREAVLREKLYHALFTPGPGWHEENGLTRQMRRTVPIEDVQDLKDPYSIPMIRAIADELLQTEAEIGGLQVKVVGTDIQFRVRAKDFHDYINRVSQGERPGVQPTQVIHLNSIARSGQKPQEISR